MPFSEDTTIVEMAKGIGVADEDIAVLSDRAKQLTRGDLLALWGADDTDGAVTAWQNARGGEYMLAPGGAKSGAPTDISLDDVATIQKLFDGARVRPAIAVRDLAGVPEALPNADVPGVDFDSLEAVSSKSMVGDIYCCCCPCCCATAVIEPAAPVA